MKLRPFTQFVLIQLIAAGVVLAMLWTIGGSFATLGWAVLLQGGVACVAAVRLRAPVWWWPIHLCFVPGVALALASGISPWWGLGALLLLLLLFRDVHRTRVPLFLSGRSAQRAMVALVRARGAVTVADLGCGTGRMLRALARQCPEARLVGVESSPLLWLLARLATWRWRQRCQVRLGNLWQQPLAEVDVVYVYLSPAPMEQLWHKVRDENPHALLISNTFGVPGVAPDEVIELEDVANAQLLLWHPRDMRLDASSAYSS